MGEIYQNRHLLEPERPGVHAVLAQVLGEAFVELRRMSRHAEERDARATERMQVLKRAIYKRDGVEHQRSEMIFFGSQRGHDAWQIAGHHGRFQQAVRHRRQQQTGEAFGFDVV